MSTSSTGLPENVATFLSYALGWLSGLVMFLVEKESATIKFHAAQSIVVFGSLTLLNILLPVIPVLGTLMLALLGPLSLALWLALLVMSLMGNAPRLPVVANYAEQLANSSKNN